jgi:hypothetical protein
MEYRKTKEMEDEDNSSRTIRRGLRTIGEAK